MKKTHRKRITRKSRPSISTAQRAKSWLLARPDFQRMMLGVGDRFAELVVGEFHNPENGWSFEELLKENLLFWNQCDDDILGEPLLHAVRELELDILRRDVRELEPNILRRGK